MESVSRSIDEKVVRIANAGHRAEVIRLEPRPRLAERISQGAATLAQIPVSAETAEPALADDEMDRTSAEHGAGSTPDLAAVNGTASKIEEPTISADRIVALIREQQELIGRILQGQGAVDNPASEIAGQVPVATDPAMPPVSQHSRELEADPQSRSLTSPIADDRHQTASNSEMPPEQATEHDRPPMIIERAQASQGMQLIGDLTSATGRTRPTWPGFVTGMALSVVLGALLYAKLGPPV